MNTPTRRWFSAYLLACLQDHGLLCPGVLEPTWQPPNPDNSTQTPRCLITPDPMENGAVALQVPKLA